MMFTEGQRVAVTPDREQKKTPGISPDGWKSARYLRPQQEPGLHLVRIGDWFFTVTTRQLKLAKGALQP